MILPGFGGQETDISTDLSLVVVTVRSIESYNHCIIPFLCLGAFNEQFLSCPCNDTYFCHLMTPLFKWKISWKQDGVIWSRKMYHYRPMAENAFWTFHIHRLKRAQSCNTSFYNIACISNTNIHNHMTPFLFQNNGGLYFVLRCSFHFLKIRWSLIIKETLQLRIPGNKGINNIWLHAQCSIEPCIMLDDDYWRIRNNDIFRWSMSSILHTAFIITNIWPMAGFHKAGSIFKSSLLQ